MSTQSGITVSHELAETFKTSKEPLVIITSPDATQLIPDSAYTPPTSTTPSAIFESLHEYLSSKFPQPSYLVVPHAESQIFISFIPDSAPIKQKMLYASTKNTLLASLGSYNFKHRFAWTELDEVSLDYFEKCLREDGQAGPMSKDEELLNKINQQQQQQHFSGFKKELASMNTSNDILYKFDAQLTQALSQLRDVGQVVIFNIDVPREIIPLQQSLHAVQPGDLIETLAANVGKGPQYIIYKYQSTKFAFIYTCPSGSSVKDRMVFAASKNSLIQRLKNEFSVVVDKNLEVGDLQELDVSELDAGGGDEGGADDSASSSASYTTASSGASSGGQNLGLRFSKPKGPRRR
ncbi:uncharacterized protein LODBEIA_P25020 [Lodderomyces beijingensis]|uniref:ADF-H domain-containing protein n=1 Tax=Lodderomyces beijingensis TaxID=1775926 RepID=A0ABP0ZJF7_9ASCO